MVSWLHYAPSRALFSMTFNKRARQRLAIAARGFIAAATLILLTATVMYQPDRDGYQGTHLFFMPRESWEMDAGRGMLHGPDYYEAIDAEIANEERYGESSKSAEYEYRDYAEQVKHESALVTTGGADSQQDQAGARSVIGKDHNSYRDSSNAIHVLLTASAPQTATGGLHRLPVIIGHPCAWSPDVPSPPPRKRTSPQA